MSENIADTEIHELLIMLEASHAVYVKELTLTEEDANATNDVHKVHYLGSGTDNIIDKNLYKTAYNNGHFFICSERNIKELCEILDCELSVDITDDPMHYDVDNHATVCESYPINMPENPEEYQYINNVHTMITANIRPKCGISAGRSDWLGRGWYYNADIYGDHAGRVLSFSTVVKTHDRYYSIEKNVND